MNVLRSVYLGAYSDHVRSVYSSDPFPLASAVGRRGESEPPQSFDEANSGSNSQPGSSGSST